MHTHLSALLNIISTAHVLVLMYSRPSTMPCHSLFLDCHALFLLPLLCHCQNACRTIKGAAPAAVLALLYAQPHCRLNRLRPNSKPPWSQVVSHGCSARLWIVSLAALLSPYALTAFMLLAHSDWLIMCLHSSSLMAVKRDLSVLLRVGSPSIQNQHVAACAPPLRLTTTPLRLTFYPEPSRCRLRIITTALAHHFTLFLLPATFKTHLTCCSKWLYLFGLT